MTIAPLSKRYSVGMGGVGRNRMIKIEFIYSATVRLYRGFCVYIERIISNSKVLQMYS